MSGLHWNAILHDVDSTHSGVFLNVEQVQKLEKVKEAADQHGDSILYGLSTVGELLVRAAESGELDKDLAMGTGWLVQSLALLAGAIQEQGEAAVYKLKNTPRHDSVSIKNVARESGGDQ
ncbi:hypothetical protein [Pseudomonas fluorescens]